jgi:hypothetical protein
MARKTRVSHFNRSIAVAIAIAALCAVGIVAYSNSFSNVLVFDDQATIARNESIRSLAKLAVLQPPADVGMGGRPFTNLTFAVNFAMSVVNRKGQAVITLFFELFRVH